MRVCECLDIPSYHDTDMDDEAVVKEYFEKDTVERSFRQMKGITSLRPVRV